MKDTEPNTIISLGIAFLCVCLGIGGCSYLESLNDLNDARTKVIEKELKVKRE